MTVDRWRTAASAIALISVSAGVAEAAKMINTGPLVEAVTPGGILAHQEALQAFADAKGGNREASSEGYLASVEYVRPLLEESGYAVTVQNFPYAFFQETSSSFEQVSPVPTAYVDQTDYDVMEYSGSGDVAAQTQAVDLIVPIGGASSTSGCEAADFDGFTAGRIAVIQRGTCTFAEKAANAEAAGAVGVVIFNEGQPGREELFFGTLGSPDFTVPVVSVSYETGVELAGLDGNGNQPVVRIAVKATSELRMSQNVIAETIFGRDDRVVLVGAHLDSVPEGPGINDNGSGSAAILEIALQMADLGYIPRNKVRFAWWGAEESGLLGSEFYVSQLTARDIKNIALNLNFDMLGSPNFVRFVYDGDGSATGTAGPNGSKNIEQVFLDYFAANALPVEPTAFDGRSDYGPFIAVGIPAGGLFSGAEEIKTPEEAEIYGGTPGVAYDPCYHQACDTLDNVNSESLGQLSDAAAHAVLTFAFTTSAVNGTGKASAAEIDALADSLEYKGNNLRR